MKWIVPLLIGLSLIGCNNKKSADEEVELIDSGMSIYQLDQPWINADGDTTYLKALAGKVVVGAMIYTSCEVACPRIVSDLKRVEDWTIEQDLGDEVHFLLVSFDPKVDTPAKLKQFAEDAQLDSDHWTLLHGDEDEVLELAAVLNVKYKKTDDVNFVHSSIIHVLNRKGELEYQKEGFETDLSQLEAAVRKVAASR